VSDQEDGEPSQRVILADFSRHLVERDGYPFAIGQPAEPADPPRGVGAEAEAEWVWSGPASPRRLRRRVVAAFRNSDLDLICGMDGDAGTPGRILCDHLRLVDVGFRGTGLNGEARRG
jgi:hypothetical protein